MPTFAKQPPYPWTQLTTSDGAFVVDRDQRIVWWSPSAERILGHRSGDVTGKPCYELVGGRDALNYRFCRRDCPVMTNARRGRPTPDYDLLCTNAAGEARWLNVSVAIPRQRRNDFQLLHLFRDVTHRRTLEEFARKTSTAFRQLLNEEKVKLADEVFPNSTPLPSLSRRESEVLRLLVAGMSTRQMADALVLRPVTVRNHIARLLTKLGVENRLQAVVYGSKRHLI